MYSIRARIHMGHILRYDFKMSSDGDASIVADYLSLAIENYCVYSASALFIYDYIVTFSDEVRLFWGRRWTGATLLFFLNRYVSLGYYAVALISLPAPHLSCIAVENATEILEVFPYLVWAAFSALRAFALSRRYVLSTLVFLLSIVPVALNLTDFYGLTTTTVTSGVCESADRITPKEIKGFTIASRGSLILADLILIVTTYVMLSRNTTSLSVDSFAGVLVRDGTLYFICLLIINILHLTFTILSIAETAESTSFAIIYSEPLTAILISRFLLNLQAVNHQALHLDSLSDRSISQNHTLVFEHVVGSLGSYVVDHNMDMGKSSTTNLTVPETDPIELEGRPSSSHVTEGALVSGDTQGICV
ncbi:hypothetical protein C8Q74DRAFT_1249696 [Fomes fomentarius]|nr:hypothetical protein C8Q74DRAFT_1249696 [Fomes fomentarius]